MIHNDFAQLTEFLREDENYDFKCAILLNNESIIMGQKAQILFRPSLLVNNRTANTELLKNSKITLTTSNYIENIPVTKTFENVKFKNNEEFTIEF